MLSLFWSSQAVGQGRTASPVRPAAASQANDQEQGLVTPYRVTADTGRMAWGRQDFAPYGTANDCDRAVDNMEREAVGRTNRWRTSARLDVTADTLSTAARVVARRCGPAFTAAGVSAPERWSFFRLALKRQDLPTAAEAVRGLVTAAPTVDRQASVLRAGVATYVRASPPVLHAARSVLAQLDGLSPVTPPVLLARIEARDAFLTYWRRVDEIDSVRATARVMQELLRQIPAVARDAADPVGVYATLMEAANDAGDLDLQERVLQAWFADFGEWRETAGGGIFSAFRDVVMLRSRVYGKTVRPLPSTAGSHWFPTSRASANDTLHPAPGKSSLLVHMNPLCRRECDPLYGILRRLGERYGDSLDVTLLVDTYGYAIGTGPISADSEATVVAAYYQHALRIPATVLVEERARQFDNAGRVQYVDSPVSRLFNKWGAGNATLIDRGGRIRWVGTLGEPFDEARFRRVFARVLSSSVP